MIGSVLFLKIPSACCHQIQWIVLNLSLVNEHFWILWLLMTAASFEGFACSKRKALQVLHEDTLFQQIKKKAAENCSNNFYFASFFMHVLQVSVICQTHHLHGENSNFVQECLTTETEWRKMKFFADLIEWTLLYLSGFSHLQNNSVFIRIWRNIFRVREAAF